MAHHGGLHRLGILLPHAGGPLEVGEKESHRARRRTPAMAPNPADTVRKASVTYLATAEAFDHDVIRNCASPGSTSS